MGFILTNKQVENGTAVLHAVQERAHNQSWEKKRARRMARMAIQCCKTESNMWVYANVGNSESQALPHDQVGSDHDSVGMFQQRVPSWGTTADCMDPKKSCHKFMDRAAEVGADNFVKGLPPRLAIQRVQVSFDPNGWNYAASRPFALWFVLRHWNTRLRTVKG